MTEIRVLAEVAEAEMLCERVTQAGFEIVDPIGERPWGHPNARILDPSDPQPVSFTPIQDIEHSASRR